MKYIKAIINYPLEFIGGALFSIMAIVVFSQVISRYVFRAPFSWPEELARLLFAWVSLIGASIGVKNSSHYNIDIFTNNLPKKIKTIYLIFIDIILVFLVLYWGWAGTKALDVASRQIYPALRISFIWLYLAIPINCGIMFIIIFSRIFKSIKKFIFENKIY